MSGSGRKDRNMESADGPGIHQDGVDSREELLRGRARLGEAARNKREALPEWLQTATGSLPMILVSMLATGCVMFYARSKNTLRTLPLKGISMSVLVDADIETAYSYVSTPDFRTEWHLGAIEVSGPAIDHSAHVGELFVEELMLDDDDVTVEWSVVDREFPASAKSIVALFVVEGLARIRGHTEQTWREMIRLRSSIHQFAKTQQVQVEMEILLDGGRKGGVNGDDDASRRWKRKLKRHIKDSLANMRSRIEEVQKKKVAGLHDAEDKKRKMPFVKEEVRARKDKE